jgi:hypothetical protein
MLTAAKRTCVAFRDNRRTALGRNDAERVQDIAPKASA